MIQPIVGRSFDVDDLILNFAGIVVGYFLAVGIKTLARRQILKRRAVRNKQATAL